MFEEKKLKKKCRFSIRNEKLKTKRIYKKAEANFDCFCFYFVWWSINYWSILESKHPSSFNPCDRYRIQNQITSHLLLVSIVLRSRHLQVIGSKIMFIDFLFILSEKNIRIFAPTWPFLSHSLSKLFLYNSNPFEVLSSSFHSVKSNFQ